METVQRIKTAFERNVQALQLRPALGKKTAVTSVRLVEGLQCEIVEGNWKIVADLGENRGGNSTGPNPGVLGRGALGSCLAMGYMMWAARLGVAISSLEVTVYADFDARGELGVAEEIPAGYLEIRYHVAVTSTAPPEAIIRVLDLADRHSSYFDVFAREQKLLRSVAITRPVASALPPS